MEDFVETIEYKTTEFEDFISTPEEKKDIAISVSKINPSSEESTKINTPLKESNSSLEDSGRFLKNIFDKRNVILNEKWEVSENVQGKIFSVNESDVHVDCLVDVESKTFQHRAFPVNLFKHIDRLSQDKMVVIKTRMKAGTIRVDVYSGEGIVNEKLFKQKDNWDSLAGSGLDDKLTKW